MTTSPITSERIDDIPLLLHWLLAMQIDTTTVSVYHQPTGESRLDFGQSKDHRPDLRQFKEVLGTLDPVGIPLCSAMVAGHCADDPLYLPVWHRLVKVIGHSAFLTVGD